MPVEVRGQQVSHAVSRPLPVRSAGAISLVACLVFLAAAVVILFSGVRSARGTPPKAGLLAVWGATAAAVLAGSMLLGGLLAGDTSLLYVAENSDPSLSIPYRVSAFWAGPQGSLLLWSIGLLAAAAALAASAWRSLPRPTEDPPVAGAAAAPPRTAAGSASAGIHAAAAATLCAVAFFLVALLVADPGSTPFAAGPGPSTPRAGLDPLLIHPAMALHPPALFLGYVGLAVPFAYAVAALLMRREQASWVRPARGWALAGWVFLSLGIGLGAWWAYVVLSWGGYWGWDPVENVSLLPWLTATALLHSLSAYGAGPAFRRWSFGLAIGAFWCTLVAAWTTRTGVITSLHAFEQRTLPLVVLSLLLAVVAATGTALLALRRNDLAGHGAAEAPGPRALLLELLTVILVLFAAAVLFSTIVAPLAFGQTVRPETYDALARPLGVAIVTAAGVCAILGDAKASPGDRWRARRWAPPLGAALAAGALLAVAGAGRSIIGLTGLSACVFTAVAALQWSARMWSRCRKARGGRWTGFVGLLRGRTFGAVVAHLGLVLTVAGLIGAGIYSERQVMELAPTVGARASVGDYRLALAGATVGEVPQGGERVTVKLLVERDGRILGSVGPALDSYDGHTAVPRADILGRAWSDVFVSPLVLSEEVIVVEAIVFPLVRFIWIGTGLLVLGGLIALWPRPLVSPRGGGLAPRPPKVRGGERRS